MEKFLISILFLASCSVPAVRENTNSVVIQQLPSPTATVRGTEESGTLPRVVTNKPFPTPEKFNLPLEDDSFEQIIEREKISKLKRLKSKSLSRDDLEIRVWQGFGITLLEGFILKRISGEWSAIDLDWDVSENRKGKRDIKPRDKKLDIPKSGWDAAWQKLVDAGILTLPNAEKIDCSGHTVDGISYVVEYKVKKTYRTYMYDNPQNAECDEAKEMIKINRIIAEEFYKREVKVDD